MRSDLSRLGLGTAQFGMPYGILSEGRAVDYKEVEKILRLARNNNIVSLDTAQDYGSSEYVIGQHVSIDQMWEWQVTTKISSVNSSLREKINESISRLGVVPHAVLAHSADLYQQPKFQNEILRVKEDFQCLKIGVSLYTREEISYVMTAQHVPEVIQVPLNVLDTRLVRDGTIASLSSKGIDIHARSVFLQGLFYMQREERNMKFPAAASALDALTEIAESGGLCLPEFSLLWALSVQGVSNIILGVQSHSQLAAHLMTAKKKIPHQCLKDALSVRFDDDSVLNPSLWRGAV